jgi:ATP-binding cassette subfamily F protein 3
VDKVYEFRNNRIKQHLGGIYDFLRAKKIDNLREIEKKEKAAILSNSTDTISMNKQKYLEKKEYERNLRKLRKRLEECETRIEQIEAEIKAVDKSFMEPGNSTDIHEHNYLKYQELREQLNAEMNNWTAFNEEIDKFLNNNQSDVTKI